MDENNLIGNDNKLPWNLPDDLKHFKELTWGKTVIMGRKTYESIKHPLPNRTIIVLSKDKSLTIPVGTVCHDLSEALLKNKELSEVFIAGGSSIYKEALPITNNLFLTIIHHKFKGDTYFPKINSSDWIITKREDHEPNNTNPYQYSFITMTKKHKST